MNVLIWIHTLQIVSEGNFKMASNDVVANEEIYNKEYRRLRTLTSQTDVVETSVSLFI